MAAGYYRFPTIHDQTIVFVCEDDLWSVPASGGTARRLTANPGQALHPALSPDGRLLAFTGRDEGAPEVYVMPAAGGPARRLTYLGSMLWVVGWTRDGSRVVFASNSGQPFGRVMQLYAISPDGGEPEALPTGPAMSISYGPQGGMAIARHMTDLARWKRYRGGLTGDIWVDPAERGDWRRLLKLAGNVAAPVWVGERIYFVSDHEGIGNLYSCLPTGEDLRRHTHHDAYYVRHPATDGRRIVYHSGADLYLFDPASDSSARVAVEFHSPQAQRKRRFVDPGRYLQSYAIHPAGHSMAVTCRGKPFTFGNWEGATIQYGDRDRVRYRLASWLADGKRLVVVSDASGEEQLEVYQAGGQLLERLADLDVGRPIALLPAPRQARVAVCNHRFELIVVDLETKTARVLDRSRYARIHGCAWSPDGNWLAYGFSDTRQTSIIKLCRLADGATFAATRPVLQDVRPAFDPEGKYLYFLSYRDFDPVYDNLHFDLNFPRGMRPYLLTLRADLPSPFTPQPPKYDDDPPAEPPPAAEQPADVAATPAQVPEGEQESGGEQVPAPRKDKDPSLHIDLEGITDRIIAFPVPIARYGQIRGIKGKALFTSYGIEGSLNATWVINSVPAARARLEVYDFAEQQHDTLIDGITSFELANDARTMIYRAGRRLRVLKAGEKPKENAGTTRKSGWIDLQRIRVSLLPPAEWEQMYREAWRLQRDHFWTADLSGVDWQTVYKRYLPLLDRVASRAEFSDLLWEMQGELGTSHAYEMGGDYRREPHYHQGFLGADLRYDAASDSYLIERIVHGDPWNARASSPLVRAGVNIQPGERLLAINGQPLSAAVAPHELLVNQADSEVLLTVADRAGNQRTVTVKTLASETAARYRDWVEANRRQVHAATDGKVGYVHIPDMGAYGYAEFHRGFLAEIVREGLVVDVRYNGGGHVSQLILEKLARRRLGYDVQRWGEPSPYPSESVLGPLVAITNEGAASDGDIFSHMFKLMQLGPLVGKRTWGGVIGISPSSPLADGGLTTQPEFSFWASDVGWNVENYGAEPTIEVDIRPQDYAAGRDTQLERAISEALRLLAEQPPQVPDFGPRPQRGLPTLPAVARDERTEQ